MRSLNCTDEQRPHRYQRNMSLVTSMAEDETELHLLPCVQFLLTRGMIFVSLGASLAGGVSALALATTPETWCKKEWGRFGGVLLDAWPWSVSYPHVTSCQALSWFVIRSQMGFAKLILLDHPLKSLNNYSRKRKMVWLWLGLQGYVLLWVAGMVTGNWIYLEIKLMPRRKSPPVKFTAVVLLFRSAEDTPVAQPPYRSRGQFKAIVLILQSPERWMRMWRTTYIQ